MTHKTNSQKHRGIATVWVVLIFMVLLAILGLMLDIAHVYLVGHQLHNAADAAALAGARYVADPDSTTLGANARAKALEYAQKNYAAKLSVNLNTVGDTTTEVTFDMALPASARWPLLSDGDVYIGRYINQSRLFIKNDPYPDAMLVVTRKGDGQANEPLPLLFAPVITAFYGGEIVENAGMHKYAVAKIENPYGAGVLALGECGCPGIIFGSGSSELVIFGGGSLYVNSPYYPGGNDGAIDQSGNSKAEVNLDRIYVVGGIDAKFDYPDDTDVHIGSDPEPDPYAGLPDAIYSTIPDRGTITETGTYSPGYYSGGIQVNGGATINLEPGNYYLDSIGQAASLSMNNGLITGENVTLHIIGDANYGININGGNMDISAPVSGPYAGVGIFQKRDPNYDCSISCKFPWEQAYPMSQFSGEGTVIIDGAVYMPTTRLELGGTGYISMTRTIADRFLIDGTSEKVVDYKGTPKIAEKSYLVE